MSSKKGGENGRSQRGSGRGTTRPPAGTATPDSLNTRPPEPTPALGKPGTASTKAAATPAQVKSAGKIAGSKAKSKTTGASAQDASPAERSDRVAAPQNKAPRPALGRIPDLKTPSLLTPSRRPAAAALARGRSGTVSAQIRRKATVSRPGLLPAGSVDHLALPQTNEAFTAMNPGARPRRGEGQDPVDRHVGLRLRERRVALGLSQTALADRLDLTFQQIQKYERGANRLSASTLLRVAEAVDVPVSYFFDGLPSTLRPDAPPVPSAASLELLRRIAQLDPGARHKVLQLLALLAPSGPVEEGGEA